MSDLLQERIQWDLLLEPYDANNNYRPVVSKVVELQSSTHRSQDEDNQMRVAFGYLITFEKTLLEALTAYHNQLQHFRDGHHQCRPSDKRCFVYYATRFVQLMRYLIRQELILLSEENAIKLTELADSI